MPIFATPITNYRFPDADALNKTLQQLILQREQSHSGVSRSNVGGWHSSTDLFEWDSDCVRELRDRLQTYVQALCRAVARNPEEPADSTFRLEGWANILRHGQYNSLHSHPNAFWSGVYYVNGNPQPEANHSFSGKLELIDPRPGASLNYSDFTNLYGRFLVNPVPGQMVIFPGWLQHQVHPYFGPGERITIAFNVIML
ncbi:MAG: TIGR02466 family protein [Candidatus Competibacteraceae bacterium]|nr:TIGR02466 family protein [Candidatus Competibacteraceae bacterium]